MHRLLLLLFVFLLAAATVQALQTDVLTLGAFHFAFPNKDARATADSARIDVLDPAHQQEIEDIVRRLSRFRPTMIAIERDPAAQPHVDSLYQRYVEGEYRLGAGEEEQIGFRLAKLFGLKQVHCVNDWGAAYENVARILSGRDSAGLERFEDYYYHNPDSAKKFFPGDVFRSEGILAELRSKNDEDHVRKDLGNYLVGIFKYETDDQRFLGTDFESGRWFNRNLRIFRNIQRLGATPSDRLLVIFGAGHLNLLNVLFDASPEYRRLKTNDFLK
jgi:hypothetical protein